ncbi:hypothetical protein LTR37_015328 [Vermiconidia calcicola]|uniref:Uncharacterized protein n=1 Tax=Vermiconidia calcicola TaxID=1690605 RepID=A0ACC3MRA7_9PEZI|nr:hypothetical protein LTR37_015328 [Vermiconidia calcicola]
MDPLSALAIATTAVQFIDFSLKTLEICRQIQNDADSATIRNKEIEEAARGVKDFEKQLISSQRQEVPEGMVEIFKKCAVTADELQRLLEHVRGAGKNLSKVKAVYRAVIERTAIEKLENTLKLHQEDLDRRILQDIWIRTDLQQMEQRKSFDDLRAHNTNVERWFSMLLERQQELSTVTQTGFDAIEQKRRRDKFLQSLYFPEIDTRRNNITETDEGTFEWLFDMNGKKERKWADFGEWLRNDGPLYWICGKAGAGKSTLMAHIADDSRTEERLKVWSRDCPLYMLSFYFWRPGSELQTSTVGLLRGLLHQLCKAMPAAVEVVMRGLDIQVECIPTWTIKLLRPAIIAAISAASGARFCFFIDGLDEYVGRYYDVLQVISALSDLGNVKCCVSSRPEIEIMRKLAKFPRLQLQDLNYDDICSFVAQTLPDEELPGSDNSSLRLSIVDRAEGVFLWAALVAAAVLRGAIAGDDDAVLRKRIEQAPQILESLFEDMFQKIDELHRESLAFYLRCVDAFRGKTSSCPLVRAMTSIAVITAAKMPVDEDVGTYGSFVRLCERTETQIIAQSAGLLQIQSNIWQTGLAPSAWLEAEDHYVNSAAAGDKDAVSEDGRFHSWSAPRRRTGHTHIEHSSPLYYEARGVGWVHRSAYDFVFHSGKVSLFDYPGAQLAAVRRSIWLGAFKYLLAAPSHGGVDPSHHHGTLTAHRVYALIASTSGSLATDPLATYNVLDEIYRYIAWVEPEELLYERNLLYPISNRDLSLCRATLFWIACVSSLGPYTTYFSDRSDILLNDPAGDVFRASFAAYSITDAFSEGRSHTLGTLARSAIDIALRLVDTVGTRLKASSRPSQGLLVFGGGVVRLRSRLIERGD